HFRPVVGQVRVARPVREAHGHRDRAPLHVLGSRETTGLGRCGERALEQDALRVERTEPGVLPESLVDDVERLLRGDHTRLRYLLLSLKAACTGLLAPLTLRATARRR